MSVDARHAGRRLNAPLQAEGSPRKLLAGRLISLGLIPIAVFCAIFVLARAFLGSETNQAQVWTLSIALAASVIGVAVLGSLASRPVMGEVQIIREALRAAAAGNP